MVIFYEYYRMSFQARGHVPLPGSGYVLLSGSGARSSPRRLKPRPENAGKCTHIHGFLKILAKGNPKPRSAAAREGIPGRETRGSGLGRGLERHARTEKPGIRAWQGAGKAPQDGKHGNTGLGRVRKGFPGPEMREFGLGWGLERRPRTGIAAIWAWVGAKKPGQDQNHRKLGLADTGCDRNNSDLQNAGTLIQLPGLYRAYERERSVKIFTFFSLRSASQAPLHRNAVPRFCKSRRTCADSTEKYSAKTEKPGAGLGHRQKGEGRTGKQGNQAWHGSGKAS